MMSNGEPGILVARTDINILKLECKWTICNASRCVETEILSPIFTANVGAGVIEWRLRLQSRTLSTNGTTLPICDGYKFTVELDFLGKPENRKWILSGWLDIEKKSEKFHPCKIIGGMMEVCSLFLCDNRLKQSSNSQMIINATLETSDGTVSEKFKHQEPFVSSNLKLHMGALFDSAKYADVKFVLGSTISPAHKAILAARSPVFEAMFRNNLEETKQGQVIISDIDGHTFKELLRFIYTGVLDNPDKTAFDLLLPAADKYGLDDLKTYCEMELCTGLTVQNVPKLLILAELHGAEKLKKSATVFIEDHPAVLKTEDWLALMNRYPSLVNAVVLQIISTK